MERLNKQNILPYLEKDVFPHLDFVSKGKLEGFKDAGGGLVSEVLRLVVDGTPFYIKQAVPGSKKYLIVLDIEIPIDFDHIFSDERQIYEAKALRIFEKVIGYGIAPHIYYHDVRNMVLVLSEVLTPKANLFENVIDKEINLDASKKLAEIAAELVNNTYGKVKPLRSTAGDKKTKFIKLKYQCLEVYSKLDSRSKKLVKEAQTELVKESMKINKVLVHGDYHPRNILVEGPKVGTCDLEEAHLGDPAFDIGILLGSYLLRIEYHKNIRNAGIKAVLAMIKTFMDKINVPENKNKLENRIKKHMGGLMLCRVDGFSGAWTKWFKKESAKKSMRKNATQLILDDSTPLPKLIKKLYPPN
ncbi:phosphotransferase [Patescibacteria group bacterium]|nr:phosphotransferase [Patescibacteria group bacterium]